MFTLRSSVWPSVAVERDDRGIPRARPDYGRDNPYVTALSAVAAVGAALATWASRRKLTQPAPAVARFGVQLSEINEGGHAIILRPGPQNPF